GEGTVDHGPLGSREPDPRALRARLEPFTREHHAGLHQLLVELVHRGQHLLFREDPGLRVLVRLHDHHEPHRRISFWFEVWTGPPPGLGRRESCFYPDVEPGSWKSTHEARISGGPAKPLSCCAARGP